MRKYHLIEYGNSPSLEAVNDTIEVPKNLSLWKMLFAYSGPGTLVPKLQVESKLFMGGRLPTGHIMRPFR